MGFFKNLGDAFSGNTAHWTSTHNPLIGELYQRADTLPQNGPSIFKRLIVISSFAVEQLVFPKQGNALLNIDLKSITKSQLEKLYTVLLSFLSAKASSAAPEIQQGMKADLAKVVGSDNTQLANQVFDDVTDAPEPMLEGVRLWKAVTGVLNSKDMDIQSQTILYATLVKSLTSGL